MKHGKAYNKSAAPIDKDTLYSPLAAARLAKAGATSSKFDQTVEVAMLLGVDPRKADQMVRSTVNLPHGTGKTARVLVIAAGEKADEARAAGADIVFCCVGNDNDLRSVVLGANGALAGMKPGAVFVDHTTASADVARELYAAAKALGLAFVDAPVSGGQAGAQNGLLTVMCGGDAPAFDAVQPIGMAFSRAFTRMGESGAGQLTKMVNQICIAGLVQGLSEAIAFGQKAGLDMNQVLDVIGKGAAQSWQMDNRGKTMVADKFDFGFAVDWMRKDLGICLETADQIGARLRKQPGGTFGRSDR